MTSVKYYFETSDPHNIDWVANDGHWLFHMSPKAWQSDVKLCRDIATHYPSPLSKEAARIRALPLQTVDECKIMMIFVSGVLMPWYEDIKDCLAYKAAQCEFENWKYCVDHNIGCTFSRAILPTNEAVQKEVDHRFPPLFGAT